MTRVKGKKYYPLEGKGLLRIICLSKLPAVLLWGVEVVRNKYLRLFFFCFLGLHLWHMEVLRLEVKLELLLLAYAIATATWDPQPTE